MIINYKRDLQIEDINLHVVSDSKGSSDELIIFLVLVILVIMMATVTFLRSRKK